MKKLIALVLTVAMLLSCFVFSASAETVATLELQGPTAATQGDVVTIMLRLNDSGKVVGGAQGTIVATGAEIVKDSVMVNKTLANYNSTGDKDTIISVSNNNVKFVAVNDLTDASKTSLAWLQVKYKITAATATFELADVTVSDKTAKDITDKVAKTTVTVSAPAVDPAAPSVTLLGSGILNEDENSRYAMNQGLVIKAGISVPADADVVEYGVVFYPTSLLEGAALEVTTEGAVTASVKNDSDNFQTYIDKGEFTGVLRFGFTEEDNALRFLGTKVTARVFYKTSGGEYVYSANTVVDKDGNENKYIKYGVSSKCVMDTALDYAATVKNPVTGDDCVTMEQYEAALDGLYTTHNNWQENRRTVLKYVIDNA